jgi:hypothetical protein
MALSFVTWKTLKGVGFGHLFLDGFPNSLCGVAPQRSGYEFGRRVTSRCKICEARYTEIKPLLLTYPKGGGGGGGRHVPPKPSLDELDTWSIFQS